MAMETVENVHFQQFLTHPAVANRLHEVKTETTSSPDLSPVPPFCYKFLAHASHDLSHSRNTSDFNLFRFGSNLYNPFTAISVPPGVHSEPIGLNDASVCTQYSHFGQPAVELQLEYMSYSDDYDDLAELPADQATVNYIGSGPSINDRTVRRRSSKACDQCRKSKCKCERSGPEEPCKNCVMLSTACTFLGPSRKRGPPKGYIDAIEARLHQTEALLGIMLSTSDSRAQSLLRDIGKDPLAKEIISRVDNSPYGVKGRKREDVAQSMGKIHSGDSSETSPLGQTKAEPTPFDPSMHPSNEWQDRVSKMLSSTASPSSASPPDHQAESQRYSPLSPSSEENQSPAGRRQRRRIGEDDYALHQDLGTSSGTRKTNASSSSKSLDQTSSGPSGPQRGRGPYVPLSPVRGRHPDAREKCQRGDRRSSSVDENSLTSESEEEFMGAVGQLSLNEDEQVRYHGKASGLHLLGNKERFDRRNEHGIWRFPKARVWPPLSSGSTLINRDDEIGLQLPSPTVQAHLLDLYFTYVQPFFPIIHKQSFLGSYHASTFAESPQSPDNDTTAMQNPSSFNRRKRRVPSLLLLSMFALAARYDEANYPPPSDPTVMWSAGDEYLDSAKIMLDKTYASSRPSTCQALLLMGYREIGIGAMAQSWTYIGMGIRMAQDLGMHRSADGWEREGLGGRLFSEWELIERKRIWYGCVIMDKYVSTYIGRPLMIFEWDFDTNLPDEDDPEEFQEWLMDTPSGQRSPGIPGRIISCFNASARLSGILCQIVQTLYAVRPVSSRYAESAVLEGLLDKWYLDLPEHLRFDPNSSKITPPPNVMTLLMQYWCAVLLLHRPFIRHVLQSKQKQAESSEDKETKTSEAKSYDLCNAAANHITSIVILYQEKYLISRCSVFFCYYVFTASIMHDTNLTVHPDDPQSRLALSRCMKTLRAMRTVWPSAARALELFRGAKSEAGAQDPDVIPLTHISSSERHKRSAEHPLDDNRLSSSVPQHVGTTIDSQTLDYLRMRQNVYSSQFANPQPIYNPPIPHLASHVVANSNFSWQPSNEMNFNTPLSTAVHPLFSTGLGDDGGHGHGRVHSHSDNSLVNSRRFPPQYFDFSSYPQLGSSSTQDTHPQTVQIPPQGQSPPPQMYVPHEFVYNQGTFKY